LFFSSLIPTTYFDVRIGSKIMQDNPRPLAQPHCEIVEAERVVHLLEALDDRREDFPLKDG
jgi:hypothetical protein